MFEFCPPQFMLIPKCHHTFCVLETPPISTWSICCCDLYISYFYSVLCTPSA